MNNVDDRAPGTKKRKRETETVVIWLTAMDGSGSGSQGYTHPDPEAYWSADFKIPVRRYAITLVEDVDQAEAENDLAALKKSFSGALSAIQLTPGRNVEIRSHSTLGDLQSSPLDYAEPVCREQLEAFFKEYHVISPEPRRPRLSDSHVDADAQHTDGGDRRGDDAGELMEQAEDMDEGRNQDGDLDMNYSKVPSDFETWT